MSRNRDLWLYELAKAWVLESPHVEEVTWASSLTWRDVAEQEFLREAAWVVLCSGFREHTVRKKFGWISIAFFDWTSGALIATNAEACVAIGRHHFNNVNKLNALVRIAEEVSSAGFAAFWARVVKDPVRTLATLPYIGSVTARHLAKNLGFPTAKADRHLVRLATALGHSDCLKMCENVSKSTGDSVSVVDTIFWRFCEQSLFTLEKPLGPAAHMKTGTSSTVLT